MQSKSLDRSDDGAGVGENGRFLRNVLKANAIFSTVSGLMFILFASSLASLFGSTTNPMIFVGLGLVILPFAIYVYKISTMEALNTRLVWVIIGLDTFWVVASAVLLLTNIVPLTTMGKWMIGFSAEIVAVFAILEFAGLRKLRR